jgi:thiamine biosynthesis protein ThiS
MDLIVNGETRTTDRTTVLGLLEELGIDPRRVAFELNREIVPKADYATTPLAAGDAVEIVHFVGGG